jgi:hypothetical protein
MAISVLQSDLIDEMPAPTNSTVSYPSEEWDSPFRLIEMEIDVIMKRRKGAFDTVSCICWALHMCVHSA